MKGGTYTKTLAKIQVRGIFRIRDIAIHRINLYPVDNTIILVSLILNSWILIYPVDSQRAKKVVSDSLRLVDFAIGLVNSVFNLPDGQGMVFEEFE